MTDIDIMGAMNYQLSQYLATNSVPVAYPNVAYEPIIGTKYLKVDILPARTSQASIGIDSRSRHIGIYQIMVIVPKEQSFVQVKPLVDGLKEYFKMNTSIVYNGLSIRVTNFQVDNYMDDDVWFYQPLSISYRADLEN